MLLIAHEVIKLVVPMRQRERQRCPQREGVPSPSHSHLHGRRRFRVLLGLEGLQQPFVNRERNLRGRWELRAEPLPHLPQQNIRLLHRKMAADGRTARAACVHNNAALKPSRLGPLLPLGGGGLSHCDGVRD